MWCNRNNIMMVLLLDTLLSTCKAYYNMNKLTVPLSKNQALII